MLRFFPRQHVFVKFSKRLYIHGFTFKLAVRCNQLINEFIKRHMSQKNQRWTIELKCQRSKAGLADTSGNGLITVYNMLSTSVASLVTVVSMVTLSSLVKLNLVTTTVTAMMGWTATLMLLPDTVTTVLPLCHDMCQSVGTSAGAIWASSSNGESKKNNKISYLTSNRLITISVILGVQGHA